MHSYKYSLLGVVAAVAMSLTAIAPASAEPIASSNPSPNSITLSAEDKMEISDILTSYGVDEEKAQYILFHVMSTDMHGILLLRGSSQ